MGFFDYEVALIVALRNEKGSYNEHPVGPIKQYIVALRNEKGSYNHTNFNMRLDDDCSTAK